MFKVFFSFSFAFVLLRKILITVLFGIVVIILLIFLISAWIITRISDSKSKKKMSQIYEASPYREKNKKQNAKPSDEFRAREDRKSVV
jgi:hypothetical protein